MSEIHPEELGFAFASRTGIGMTLEALLSTPVDALAFAAKQSVDDFLADVDRWSQNGDGFKYGVIVDREAQTIRQVQVA